MFADAQLCVKETEAEQRLYRLVAEGTTITVQDPLEASWVNIPDLVGRL